MTLAITPLHDADRTRWTELWRGYLEFYETALPASTYDHTWARLMQDTEIHGRVARDGDAIVGIVHFLYHAHCWTPAPACYLQDLFVDRAIRGQGAGRMLIEAVAAHAVQEGATRLYWMTQGSNVTARQLYDRLATHRGFIRYEHALPS